MSTRSQAELAEEVDYEERVRLNIFDNASFSIPFMIMNILSTIVASCGLLANNIAVVIGAMVIASLLGPIVGISLGLLESHSRLLKRALLAEAIGILLVLGVSFLIGLLYQGVPVGNEIQSRTFPTTFDW